MAAPVEKNLVETSCTLGLFNLGLTNSPAIDLQVGKGQAPRAPAEVNQNWCSQRQLIKVEFPNCKTDRS